MWRKSATKKITGQVLLEGAIVLICLAMLAIGTAQLFQNLNLNQIMRFDVYRKSRVDALNNPSKLRRWKPKTDQQESAGFSFSDDKNVGSPVFFLDYFPKTSLGLEENVKVSFAGWLGAFLDDPRIADGSLLIQRDEFIEDFIMACKFKQASYYAKELNLAMVEGDAMPSDCTDVPLRESECIPHWVLGRQQVISHSGVAYIGLIKSLIQDVMLEDGDEDIDADDVGLMYQAYNSLDRAIGAFENVLAQPLYYDYASGKVNDGPYASAFDPEPDKNPKLYGVDFEALKEEHEGDFKGFLSAMKEATHYLEELKADHADNIGRMKELIGKLNERKDTLYSESGGQGGLIAIFRLKKGKDITWGSSWSGTSTVSTGDLQFWGFQRVFDDLGLVNLDYAGDGSVDPATGSSGGTSTGPYLLIGGSKEQATYGPVTHLKALNPYSTPPYQLAEVAPGWSTISSAGDHQMAVSTIERFARFLELKDFSELTKTSGYNEFDSYGEAISNLDYDKLGDKKAEVEAEYEESLKELAIKKFNLGKNTDGEQIQPTQDQIAQIKQEQGLYGSVRDAFYDTTTLVSDLKELQMSKFLNLMAADNPVFFERQLADMVQGLYSAFRKDCNDLASPTRERYYERILNFSLPSFIGGSLKEEALTGTKSAFKRFAEEIEAVLKDKVKLMGASMTDYLLSDLKDTASYLKDNLTAIVELLREKDEVEEERLLLERKKAELANPEQPGASQEDDYGLTPEEIDEALKEMDTQIESIMRMVYNYIDTIRMQAWALCKVAEATDRTEQIEREQTGLTDVGGKLVVENPYFDNKSEFDSDARRLLGNRCQGCEKGGDIGTAYNTRYGINIGDES